MDEDRVKDPLGQYEEFRRKTRPDETWDGFIVAGWVVSVATLLALISFLLRRLIG